MDRIKLLMANLESVRRYTKMTLDGIGLDKWFCISNACPTHVAWQVGHIAIGQYGLALALPRGVRAEDEELIPASFRQHFARGSTPDPSPNANPSVELILSVFSRVHEQVLAELPNFTAELLDEPTAIEHPMFSTKFGSLMWCIQHEYTHAGQISLLYRLLGGKPRF